MRLCLAEAVVARRDREARRHALHVVLERARQRLVEVVQVEQQDSLGRREQTEVRQMSIAAELNHQAGPGRVLQVGGHDLGRAPIEGERRHHHPPVAYRHEVRLTRRVLLLEQRDRVGRSAAGFQPAWPDGGTCCLASFPFFRRCLTLGCSIVVGVAMACGLPFGWACLDPGEHIAGLPPAVHPTRMNSTACGQDGLCCRGS